MTMVDGSIPSGQTTVMPAAVIFDFDGVIVDTEPLHWRAFQKVLAPTGMTFSWEEYLGGYVGLDDRGAFRKAFDEAGIPLGRDLLCGLIGAKAQAFGEAVTGGVNSYPGVLKLIRSLAPHLPLGLCSGALRSDILPVLKQFELTDCFSVLVSAEDVTISKPDPESYRLALAGLAKIRPDLDPGACLAIEDTPAGIAAAQGAGMAVLAVTNNFPAGDLRQATEIVSSLENLDAQKLGRIVFGSPSRPAEAGEG